MLRFGAQFAKISNRRKYPLYGSFRDIEQLSAIFDWPSYANLKKVSPPWKNDLELGIWDVDLTFMMTKMSPQGKVWKALGKNHLISMSQRGGGIFSTYLDVAQAI